MQNRTTFFAMIVCLSLLAAASVASAQVSVQLPTFNSTGVSTTVMVPDRGQTFLGGINRASSSSNQFGVPLLPGPGFGNRSFGSDRSATNFWARVWIHDFDAMDEALLQQAAANRGAGSSLAGAQTPAAASMVQAQPTRPKSELTQLLTRDRSQPVDAMKAADLQLTKARELAAAGKLGVAKIYYQMAIRRSQGDEQAAIVAELNSLTQSANVAGR